MRKRLKIAVALALLVAAGAAAYAELVLDVRTPQSLSVHTSAIGLDTRFSPIAYDELPEETKAKLGEMKKQHDVQVIVEVARKRTGVDVIGLIALGAPESNYRTRFPFRIALDQNPAHLKSSLAAPLKARFGASLPSSLLAFTDRDWEIGHCVTLPAGLGLGLVGRALRLQQGTACRVTWKGPRPGSMLILVATADGDPWMRPFARRLCRAITEAAIQQVKAAHPGEDDHQAACILADRPGRTDAQEALSVSVYSAVGVYFDQLALMPDGRSNAGASTP